MQKSNRQGSESRKAIALVHGGFVDGSGWAGVYKILKEKGYNVAVVQNPTKSLADDVAFTKSAIDSLKSEVVLVGHSYGGVVITEAGDTSAGERPSLHRGLCSRQRRIGFVTDSEPSTRRTCPANSASAKWLSLPRSRQIRGFVRYGCGPGTASFMADSQVPWGVNALSGAVSEPAWKTKPTYYLIASDDKMIPPPAQRKMAERAKARVAEVAGSHSVYVSNPRAVAAIIESR